MRASDSIDLKQEMELLRRQNAQLQQQVQKQQEMLETFGSAIAAMETKYDRIESQSMPTLPEAVVPTPQRSLSSRVIFSGEGAIGLFRTGSHGQFPNTEMRVDEAKLFVDAQISQDAFFFSEINLTRRTDGKAAFNLGEIYVDFENISGLWNLDGLMSLRVGRLDIPFGEEYLARDAIDSPLIANSLADFWGVDEGVEIYGMLGGVQYVVAVQNGSHPGLHDYNSDKSIVGRVSWDPAKWFHLGFSAMRTGDIDVKGDKLSELWFGNGFIRSLGGSNTSTFEANLFQGNSTFRWSGGSLGLAGGGIRYSDNDPDADNRRNVHFYSAEIIQHFTSKFHLAARYSKITARDGFPLVGDGEFREYFFEELSNDLSRMTIGMGYRLRANLLLKADYSFNHGHSDTGEVRNSEDLFATEVAYKF